VVCAIIAFVSVCLSVHLTQVEVQSKATEFFITQPTLHDEVFSGARGLDKIPMRLPQKRQSDGLSIKCGNEGVQTGKMLTKLQPVGNLQHRLKRLQARKEAPSEGEVDTPWCSVFTD